MPLYIRDDSVDALASELQRMTHARSKTEAVRHALIHALSEAKSARPVGERLAKAKQMAAELGPTDPDFDMKAFSDELWDGR